MLLNDLDIYCMKYVAADLSRSCIFSFFFNALMCMREFRCLKQLAVSGELYRLS